MELPEEDNPHRQIEIDGLVFVISKDDRFLELRHVSSGTWGTVRIPLEIFPFLKTALDTKTYVPQMEVSPTTLVGVRSSIRFCFKGWAEKHTDNMVTWGRIETSSVPRLMKFLNKYVPERMSAAKSATITILRED
jgi:hypothetical protein